jgi:hypothetical protein
LNADEARIEDGGEAASDRQSSRRKYETDVGCEDKA